MEYQMAKTQYSVPKNLQSALFGRFDVTLITTAYSCITAAFTLLYILPPSERPARSVNNSLV
jgi:quinol-cytochrome oxidoreductase complex cytochrome b subunit